MLTLPIKGKWFYMILSGEKGEEYREIKPYCTSRFKKIFDMHPHSNMPYGIDKREIRFRNGYGSSRPEFIALCTLDIMYEINNTKVLQLVEWEAAKHGK